MEKGFAAHSTRRRGDGQAMDIVRKMARPAGIREVAEAAGVSITTVSHVINGKGRLPPATRDRVLEVARRLDYRPSSAARNLVRGRTGLIAVSLAQAEAHPVAMTDFAYFMQLVGAATGAAVRRGYALVLSSETDARDSVLGQVPVDGGIVIDPIRRDPDVKRLRALGAPVVTIGRVPGEPDGNWVDNDHSKGMRSVLDHLAKRGAGRIALVGIPLTTTYADDTTGAYTRWCEATGSRPQIEHARDFTEAAGFEAAMALLRSRPRPDAICAQLDRLALGVLLAAETAGIAVPAELLVAGITNSEASRRSRPSLTALDLHPESVGANAVNLLLDLVEGRDPPEPRMVVPTRLISRSSTRRR